MRRTIPLRDCEGNETAVEFMATAATPILFKRTFRRDLFGMLKELSADNPDLEAVFGLAFVMACEARGETPRDEDFVPWLSGLDGGAMMEHVREIIGVYYDAKATSATAKNQAAPLTGR